MHSWLGGARLDPVDLCLKTEPSELDWLQVYDDTLMKNWFKDWSQSSKKPVEDNT